MTRAATYYEDDLVRLYHGDCLEVTDWLEADVLVTDPPYGIGWTQNAGRFTQNGRSYDVRKRDGIQNDGDASVRDAAIALFGLDRPSLIFGSPLQPPPRGCKQVLIWQKAANSGVLGALGGWRRDVECVYMLGRWAHGAARSAVIATSGSVNAGGRIGHPHAKPVALMEQLVHHTQGAIADPFAGSGSTLLAAKLLGRRAIGVELDERYCEIAAKRLAQDALFGGAA